MKAVPLEIQWQPENSVYASPGFLASVSNEYGWLGGRNGGGELQFILPYTVVKQMGVRMIRFRVETMLLHPGADGMEEEKAFLNDALRHFSSLGADVIIPASTNTLFRTYPDSAAAVPYGSYILDLTRTEEELWKRLHAKHRNVIRNAQKKGVQIISGPEHAAPAYQLIAETFKRSAMPFMDYDAFQRMMDGLGEYVKVFVALYEGVIQGCAVIPFSRHSAYYAYGGTTSAPLTGAANLLQWEAIRHFRDLGTRRYDFCGARIDPDEGTKAAGLVMFKERFGAELVRGYMWKSALRPLKAAIYGLGVRLTRGGDIVDQERQRFAKRGVREHSASGGPPMPELSSRSSHDKSERIT